MGICQSYFGASTSGQGLSARQLAACIRAAARAAASEGADKSESELDYKSFQTVTLKSEASGDNDNNDNSSSQQHDKDAEGSTLMITSFASAAFRHLRGMEGIRDDFFEKEWVLPEDHIGLRETEGRSRAMFLVSRHRCLLCKTVSEGEVNTLLSMLPHLVKHFTDHAQSLLQRFVLALRIEEVGTKEVGWVVVFTDIFAKSPVIHEKWDLKGRQPKCAKYLFLPQQDSNSNSNNANDANGNQQSTTTTTTTLGARNTQQTTTAAAAAASGSGSPKKTRGSNNSNRHDEGEEMSSMGRRTSTMVFASDVVEDELDEDTWDRPVTKVYGDGYNRVIGRKDKELTRVFWIPKENHEHLQQTIKTDADFLASQGILDYSILLGVKYVDPTSKYRAMRFTAAYHPYNLSKEQQSSGSGKGENDSSSCSGSSGANNNTSNSGSDIIPSETRDTCDGVEFSFRSKFHRGIDSSAKLEVYYIGVIDMLTIYTVPKKAANFFKNFLWTDATLSTVPPETYRDRYVDFMSKIFLVGPE